MGVLGRAHEAVPLLRQEKDGLPSSFLAEDLRNWCRPQVAAPVAGQDEIPFSHLFDRLPAPVGHRDERSRREALVLVAHDADVPVPASQALHQLELGVVGVLVLVHEEEPARRGVALRDTREALEEKEGLEDQVVEVDGAVLLQPFLVSAVDPGEQLPGRTAGLLRDLLDGLEEVLGRADAVQHRPGRLGRPVHAQLLEARPKERELVRGVIDHEARGVSEHRAIPPQDPQAESVEGPDPCARFQPAQQMSDPLLHLAGGLVREGHGHDLPRSRDPLADEVGQAVRDHTGLSGAGSREDQQRS